MSDQAQGLRVLADRRRCDYSDPRPPESGSCLHGRIAKPATPATAAAVQETFAVVDSRLHRPRSKAVPHARVIAVTSGKGGVGKSSFSANLAIALGHRGARVVILDADMGLANAHILLGVSPKHTLEELINGAKSVREVLCPVARNVQLAAGGSGITELANLSDKTREALLSGLRELDTTCDLIVIDTGAGVADNVMGFLSAVNEIVILTTPEPTAIADAYATIKVVSQENPEARIMVVVNMVHSSREGAAVAEKLSAITRQFLDRAVEYVGCIPIDPAVPKAVRQRTPFVSSTPGCAAAAGINQIIRRLGLGRPDPLSLPGADGFASRLQRFFGIGAHV